MKAILKFTGFVLLTGVLFYISCQKELSCEDCKSNQPPIANAGKDTTIVLPVDSVTLDGSASSDPEGTISEWIWTKISGPSSFTLRNATMSTTFVTKLATGVYQFELKVKDDLGLSTIDTVQITVDDPAINQRPIANAGKDTTVVLPNHTAWLDGSGSSDPDSNIRSYAWVKVSGPTSYNMASSNTVRTEVINLGEGTYLFELKVTDSGMLSSKDTILVKVTAVVNNDCVLSQTHIGSLSIPRSSLNILAAADKIVFAGGFSSASGPPMYGASPRVDIYDIVNKTWKTAELSVARFDMGTIAAGNKIYFAGGDNGSPSSRVDIYDALHDSWATAELSVPREAVIAVAAGNKVLFAGGLTSQGASKIVDIYDQENGNWSTATLTDPTAGSFLGYYFFAQSGVVSSRNKIYIITSSNNIDVYDAQTNTWSKKRIISPNQLTQGRIIEAGSKIYFSGSVAGSNWIDYNYANTLEIYDISADSWSTVHMLQSRAYMAAIAGDDMIFWAGGFDSSWDVNGEEAIRPVNNIEIYDVNTGLHSFHELQQQEWWVKALKTTNKIFFTYGNHTESYDLNSHSWTICSIRLDQALAIGNTVFQVGPGSQVWKLEF